MFKVQLQLVSLVTDINLDTPLTLKIRKGHWHFSIVEKVESPVLNVDCTFQLSEEEGKDSTFQIQLISKISQNKAKLIGSASINVKEYPMDNKKSDRIRLGSHAWLDIQLSYNYVTQKNSQSEFDSSQLQELQNAEVFLDVKEKNERLKYEIQQLSQLRNQLQEQYKSLQEDSSRLKQIRTVKQKQFFRKQMKIEQQYQQLTDRLHETNYTLTALINLIYDHGDMGLISSLNDVLCSGRSVNSKSSKPITSSQKEGKDMSIEMLRA